ncbi:MAG: hypothetical protein JWL59_529 [Chthoniobacteraceae bacterium]|nr:hypothetical protein [Chthoniobacteraceae bacterium]
MEMDSGTLLFDRVISSIFESAQENTLENQDLATLRDTLLPKLLSGEVSAVKPALARPQPESPSMSKILESHFETVMPALLAKTSSPCLDGNSFAPTASKEWENYYANVPAGRRRAATRRY